MMLHGIGRVRVAIRVDLVHCSKCPSIGATGIKLPSPLHLIHVESLAKTASA
jgi:hypothetical protein